MMRASWFYGRRVDQVCTFLCLALAAEGLWGAVKFKGFWYWAYGGAGFAASLLALLFFRRAIAASRPE